MAKVSIESDRDTQIGLKKFCFFGSKKRSNLLI